jgi:hypothetical protein
MIPLLTIGFLDPLEGLPLLVVGLALAVTVRLLSRVRFPRITWISVLVVAVLMSLTLGFAIAESMPQTQPTGDTVGNPLMNEIMLGSLPVVLILLWLSRAAEVVMVVGLVVYSVKLFTARSAAKRP